MLGMREMEVHSSGLRQRDEKKAPNSRPQPPTTRTPFEIKLILQISPETR